MEYDEVVTGGFLLPLLEADVCGSLLQVARKANNWKNGRLSASDDTGGTPMLDVKLRSARVLSLTQLPNLLQEFDHKVDAIVKPLMNRVWQTNITDHADTQVVRYGPGDFFAEHSDLIPKGPERYFSIVCYLNDDFMGGTTHFTAFNHKIVPQQGKAIIFPSNYKHCAEPVTKGEKYVIVSWLVGPSFGF